MHNNTSIYKVLLKLLASDLHHLVLPVSLPLSISRCRRYCTITAGVVKIAKVPTPIVSNTIIAKAAKSTGATIGVRMIEIKMFFTGTYLQ